jgi:prepilin-type N-terminal cleavage/methylation domain-containing protein
MRALRSERGFTLMELVVGMTLLVALLGASSPLLATMIRHNGEIQERSVLQTEARTAVDRLARELRQAYIGDGTPPIETMTASQVTFLSPDKASPFHNRRISYRVTSGALQRATAVSTDTDGAPWSIPALGSWRTVVGSLSSSSIFTYLDANGAVTGTAANVRSVRVTLPLATRTSQSRALTYRSTVQLRATG